MPHASNDGGGGGAADEDGHITSDNVASRFSARGRGYEALQRGFS